MKNKDSITEWEAAWMLQYVEREKQLQSLYFEKKVYFEAFEAARNKNDAFAKEMYQRYKQVEKRISELKYDPWFADSGVMRSA